jgi:hypothetical protein
LPHFYHLGVYIYIYIYTCVCCNYIYTCIDFYNCNYRSFIITIPNCN